MRGSFAIVLLLWYAFVISVGLGSTALAIYGFYLAFCASMILGVASFFVPPAPLVFGVAQFFFHTNLPALIMEYVRHTH